MTFIEAETSLPNGFHDAKIEKLLIDYLSRNLLVSMQILVGTPGMPNEEDYATAELVVNGLYFCAIESPESTYPWVPDGRPLSVSGSCCVDSQTPSELLLTLPPGAGCYRFFVEQWNSFIQIAGADVQISWRDPQNLVIEA
jgi:hypothetical protein